MATKNQDKNDFCIENILKSIEKYTEYWINLKNLFPEMLVKK